MKNWLRLLQRGVIACSIALGLVSGRAVAQATFVPGEFMVMTRTGTAPAVVDVAAAAINAKVVRRYGTIDWERTIEAYHLRMNVAATEKQTTDALAVLKTNPQLHRAGHNKIFQAFQAGSSTPNDPRFSEQWDKVMMKMPQAWAIEKGQGNVIVCVIDSAIDYDHPEFAGRTLPGFNGLDGSTNPRGPAAVMEHGTHVSGIAMAQGDNGQGIAGVAHQNVKLMGMRTGTDGGGLDGAALVAALQEALKRHMASPTSGFVVNLSLGGTAPSDTPDPNNLAADEIAVMALAKSGVVLAIAAGNSFTGGNPPISPAYLAQLHPNILCVASVGPNGTHAAYSSARKYTTLTAPGGDDSQGKTVLSTWPGNTYNSIQGTSMSSPQVAGAIALLLSIPGVRPEEVKGIFTSTATPIAGQRVPDDQNGYGLINVAAALEKVAVSVTVAEPDGTGGKAAGGGVIPEPIETLRPTVRVIVSQVLAANLTLKIDDTTITDYVIENIRASQTISGVSTPVSYDVVITGRDFSPGTHKIEVIGVKPGPPDKTVTDTRNFKITPYQVPAGRSLISIPYLEDGAIPETYFGTTFRLARWVPGSESYAFYTSFEQAAAASFNPPGAPGHTDGSSTNMNPLGSAYFADAESIKPVLTRGAAANRTFVIPLKGRGSSERVSWNMVGCPFPFDVPLNACLVDGPGGRIPISTAVERGLILPSIFSYDGVNGYTFRVLPDGVLQAWQGHWIGVSSDVDISLVVPPARIPRSRASSLPVVQAGRDGWKMKISAGVGRLNDAFNFIGVAPNSADGEDLTDVPKPPMVSPYVTVGLIRENAAGRKSFLAQDMRAVGGTKSWSVVVDTDQLEAEGFLRWAGVGSYPRNVKLTIKDETTGQSQDMRTRSSITFTTNSQATTRRYTITASPSLGGAVRISNVLVRSGGRASGTATIDFSLSSDARYEVRIMNGSGAHTSTVASRAGSAGDVKLVWNGKDSAGRSVPAGTYLVQIRAVSPDGDIVKAIQPFAVTR